MKGPKEQFKKKLLLSLLLPMALIIMFSTATVASTVAQGQEGGEAPISRQVSPEQAEVLKFALIAAAIAFGFGAIGAGIAIANVGAAAMGAIGEKPEIASQALIFIALAEGLVVFGFITALMILGKV